MARITFDTDNPVDIELITNLLDSGMIDKFETAPNGNGNGNGSDPRAEVSLDKAVHLLLSSVGDDTKLLMQEIMVQSEESDTAPTLQSIADGMDVSYATAKARKLNLGRTIKKVQAQFPGLPNFIESEWDAADKLTTYHMPEKVRAAMADWFEAAWSDDA